MCLIAQIRALVTTLVLASYSPLAIAHGSPDLGHTGHLAISLFVARRTRVAASQQFDVANYYRVSGHTSKMSGVPTSNTNSDNGAPSRA
jgi:hypothetical protein